ncbi:PQQ-dependent sugar dehydrogenase [Actinophytocola sediminis]
MAEPVVVSSGLNFPTSIVFDTDGRVYVAESGLPFGGARRGGRVLRFDGAGEPVVIADELAPPVTGLCWHDGDLYVSEGGAGRITRIDSAGTRTVVVDRMPGPGNYHTNMAVVGADRKLYFGQGAMSNLGVIGLDAYELGWLRRLPHAHDIPGLDITLTGENITTRDPFVADQDATTRTGAFVPFGTTTQAGQTIEGALPCTAAVMRCDLDGSNLELVAWGIRNAFGLGFLPDGRLLAVDQGSDDRGSRPIGNAPDLLFEVRRESWYGWPDFIGGVAVTEPRFQPVRGPQPTFLLSAHDTLPKPEGALVEFEPHAAATKFAVVPTEVPGLGGRLVVTLFGDETPMTAPHGHPQVGRDLLLVDPDDWSTTGLSGGPELFRPIDVAFSPVDGALHIVDFGQFEMSDDGVLATAGSGRVWRWPDWAPTAGIS